MKPRILVVGDYNRKDFVEMFYACQQDLDFYFIEFLSPAEVKSEFYKAYGKAIFWKDFANAFDLLKQVKPSKVVFYFIESFNHVALNVACKALGIKTYHLDHGFLDLDRQQKMIVTQLPVRMPAEPFLIRKMASTFKNKLQNRLFFRNTIRKSSGPAKGFLKQYYNIRKNHSIDQTFRLVNSSYRLADEYLCFCQATFEQLVIRDHLTPDYPVHYIGVPVFDKWARLNPAIELKNYLLFIPQPFVEQGFFGWTNAFEQNFIQELVQVCKASGLRLLIKLHPYQNRQNWQFFSDQKDLRIISDEEMLEVVPETKLIGGFFSTLLLPMAALPHTMLFTIENHPVRSVFPSAFLTEAGVAFRVNEVLELKQVFDDLDQIKANQQKNKAAFIRHWLCSFDGQAGENLKTILKTEC